MLESDSQTTLFCRRVFVAKQPIRRLILFNARKPSRRRVEAIIRIIVVALADLANQHGPCPLGNGKIMIQPRWDSDAHAWFKANLSSCRNDALYTIQVQSNIAYGVHQHRPCPGRRQASGVFQRPDHRHFLKARLQHPVPLLPSIQKDLWQLTLRTPP